GKTTPRSLRHFPYKDANGKVDLPHLRNALARIPQSSLSADVKARAIAKAQSIAKANGIDTGKSQSRVEDWTDVGKSANFLSESLVYYGGEVKALPDGKIGGYLVLFTGPDDPDLSRDYFTKSTEFYVENGDKVPILYDHGLDRTIKKRLLGRATAAAD